MNTQALIEHEPTPIAPMSAITPMAMLSQALERGATPEMLEKLLALQERWESSQARKAFDTAVADAKAEIPIIAKNAVGHNNKRYANFAAYAGVIDPILGKHGLSYRFRTKQDAGQIQVTCVLSHRAGHSEENTLSGPPDTTGSKNVIQAIGSTLMYFQRYTLVQALGLAAAEDDDGKASGRPVEEGGLISNEQRDALLKLCEETGMATEKFCEWAKIEAVSELAARNFQKAVNALEARRAKKS